MILPAGCEDSPFEARADTYDAWFDDTGKLIFACEVAALKKVLSSLPDTWLEVGVGTGRFAQALGIKTGIDPSGKMLEIARKRGIEVFQARGEERVFDKEKFGTVFLLLALCFIDLPLPVLKEANRILKSGGKLVIGMVLKDSPWGKYYQKKKEDGHFFYRHATYHSYREMEEILAASGFAIEREISTLFQGPGEVKDLEIPVEGYLPDAGFTVIVAGKSVTK